MPKDRFSSAAQTARQPTPSGAFPPGTARAPEPKVASAFGILRPTRQSWQLAPIAPRTEPETSPDASFDPDEIPLSHVMAWLGAMPKGDDAVYEMQQELLRQDGLYQSPTVLMLNGDGSDFQKVMQAGIRAHDVVEHNNTTALSSAAWMHHLILEEQLARRAMRSRFGRASSGQPGRLVVLSAAGLPQLRRVSRLLTEQMERKPG